MAKRKTALQKFLSENGRKAGAINKAKGSEYFSAIAKKRFEGKTKEEIADYMNMVRQGKSPKTAKV